MCDQTRHTMRLAGLTVVFRYHGPEHIEDSQSRLNPVATSASQRGVCLPSIPCIVRGTLSPIVTALRWVQ